MAATHAENGGRAFAYRNCGILTAWEEEGQHEEVEYPIKME